MDFIIFAPPRSRTAWLANFLTYENSYCYHEALAKCSKVSDLKDMRIEGKLTGNSDSGMLLFPDKILDMFPSAKVVLVKKPTEEVAQSLLNLFPEHPSFCLSVAQKSQTEIDKILIGHREIIAVEYHELVEESICEEIWNHCNPYRSFDSKRWKMLSNFNVQLDKIEFNTEQIKTLMNNEKEEMVCLI